MVEHEKFARVDALFREPSPPDAVEGSSDGLHRRLAPAGASSDSEARYEAPPPQASPPLPAPPASAPRRTRSRRGAYQVAIVRLGRVPANRENPYASLSAAERYECLMKRLAEVWCAISKRRGVNAAPVKEHKKAA